MLYIFKNNLFQDKQRAVEESAEEAKMDNKGPTQ